MTSRSPAPDPPGDLDVRGGCLRVAARARHVRLDEAGLGRLATELAAADPALPAWEDDHLAGGDPEVRAGWTLLLSALNFCFWEDEPRWRVEGADGYMALAAALRRAHRAGTPVARPAHLAGWSVADLAGVLRGDPGGPAAPPLLAERHAVTAELGEWLVEEHGGAALAPLLAAPSAAALAATLATRLGGFRDVAVHRGEPVALLKRAQIAAHDCGLALGDDAPAGLRDRRGLTAFADYKVPQVLRAAGAIAYTPELAAAVDARTELAAGSEPEVEIRALTVVAVDRLVALLAGHGRGLDAPAVDTLLWWRGQGLREPPYHRTRTVWY
ncbi:MAG TPA: queuosine salvage family protein [Candidatus Dormibacteraeota bacterium]